MGAKEPIIKGPLPGPKARALIERDAKSRSPSLIKVYPLVVSHGEGSWVEDVDGNRFLDLMAGIAVTATGHSHPKVVQAIQKSAEKFLHICMTDFFYESATRLQEKLASYVPAMGAKRVFLTNSGTEAVEGALKLARFHTRRTNIIAFKGAFHGRTMGAITLNASKAGQRAFFGPLLPGVYHVPYANPYRAPARPGMSADDAACAHAIDAIEKDLFVSFMNPQEVAAIIVEPIQGEGGYIVPPKKFLQELRRICDTHGIVLIFDEIQCGAGRTGDMYAAETFGVAPDIFLSAKGLGSGMPIGAFVAKESIMTWPAGSHGSTYAGNPVCCEAALATLEVVEGLLPNVRQTGELFMHGLRELQKKHPVLGDVRGKGLMIGAEFVDPKTKEPAGDYTHELEVMGFHKGILLLSCGKSTIRFAPPLVITPDEIKTGLRILDECMTELDRKFGY
jgi:4-aminobutyrate aminotransferase